MLAALMPYRGSSDVAVGTAINYVRCIQLCKVSSCMQDCFERKGQQQGIRLWWAGGVWAGFNRQHGPLQRQQSFEGVSLNGLSGLACLVIHRRMYIPLNLAKIQTCIIEVRL